MPHLGYLEASHPMTNEFLPLSHKKTSLERCRIRPLVAGNHWEKRQFIKDNLYGRVVCVPWENRREKDCGWVTDEAPGVSQGSSRRAHCRFHIEEIYPSLIHSVIHKETLHRRWTWGLISRLLLRGRCRFVPPKLRPQPAPESYWVHRSIPINERKIFLGMYRRTFYLLDPWDFRKKEDIGMEGNRRCSTEKGGKPTKGEDVEVGPKQTN